MESILKFFTDNKIQLGTAHSEYAQYWSDNSLQMPSSALRLSAGMLPDNLLSNIADPIYLHDARIQKSATAENQLSLTLHGDDHGSLREIEIRYDCGSFQIPEIPNSLVDNTPQCDLMCHEFRIESDSMVHEILFAIGIEIAVQFRGIQVEVTPDRDITMR